MTLDEEMVLLLDYYDREVVRLICNKYDYTPQDALHKFLASKTYQMLCNPQLAMWEFSPSGIFDVWECEQITGNPKTSRYIRRD